MIELRLLPSVNTPGKNSSKLSIRITANATLPKHVISQ